MYLLLLFFFIAEILFYVCCAVVAYMVWSNGAFETVFFSNDECLLFVAVRLLDCIVYRKTELVFP